MLEDIIKPVFLPEMWGICNAFKEDEEKCLSAGMSAHLAKPLDMEKVKKTICEQIQRERR